MKLAEACDEKFREGRQKRNELFGVEHVVNKDVKGELNRDDGSSSSTEGTIERRQLLQSRSKRKAEQGRRRLTGPFPSCSDELQASGSYR
jgi:hypothetical protein